MDNLNQQQPLITRKKKQRKEVTMNQKWYGNNDVTRTPKTEEKKRAKTLINKEKTSAEIMYKVNNEKDNR